MKYCNMHNVILNDTVRWTKFLMTCMIWFAVNVRRQKIWVHIPRTCGILWVTAAAAVITHCLRNDLHEKPRAARMWSHYLFHKFESEVGQWSFLLLLQGAKCVIFIIIIKPYSEFQGEDVWRVTNSNIRNCWCIYLLPDTEATADSSCSCCCGCVASSCTCITCPLPPLSDSMVSVRTYVQTLGYLII